MKIIIIIIHIILLSRFELASQNFIYNEGFEELGTGKNWPTGVAQADNLNIVQVGLIYIPLTG